MIEKTYKSGSCVHINLFMPKSKSNIHLSFNPISGGGSTFTTTDEDIQKALESHRNFGTLFGLTKSEEIKESEVAAETESEAEDGAEKKTDTIPVNVSDLNDAKEYLANTFNISRSALRSKVAINAAAAAHNIEFIYPEE